MKSIINIITGENTFIFGQAAETLHNIYHGGDYDVGIVIQVENILEKNNVE